MAGAMRKSGGKQQPSRLQRQAPPSLQISPVTDWNAAIPLLTPLVTSPPSLDLTVESQSSRGQQRMEPEKPVVFKKWQHPAAPLCYEPAPLVPFLCSGAADRS
ncbi:hypothetical protein NMG60_11032019 [Bertholletia excelsa]